jgi:hypothetical protein
MRRPEQIADSDGWNVGAPARALRGEARMKAKNLGMVG